MAESETLVLLAVFDDISAADHAVDLFWDWSEGERGSDPAAIGVLVNQDRRLDAQLIGDDSGFGEETGAALDILEELLHSRAAESGGVDESQAAVVEALITMLELGEAFVKNLSQELDAGHAILLLIPTSEELDSSRDQFEKLGGRISVITVPRKTLFRAAAALNEYASDDDFDDYEEQEDYESYENEDGYDDYDDYDDYDEDEDEDEDDKYTSGNGRYR